MHNVPVNVVPIKNGINFRDLGGIKTQDGRQVRSGMLFRSGALSEITEDDKHILSNDISIRYILDYRDESEVLSKPDQIWVNSTYINVPANPLSKNVSANLKRILEDELSWPAMKKETPIDFMIELYRLLPFNNAAYNALVDLLLNSNGQSFIQHCAVGKDRTGVGVALTLFALGVDENTIMADYLLTEKLLADYRENLFSRYAKRWSSEELTKRKAIYSAKPAYLMAAIEAIKYRYQTIDNWLEEEYQLTAKNRQLIQNYYLI